MKKLLFICLFLTFGANQILFAQNDDQSPVYCMVLDKTLSMKGHGDNGIVLKNIWDDVQKYCHEWVDYVATPSTVLLFTFDTNLSGPQVFKVSSDADKTKIKDALKNIVVDGQHTHIVSNLSKVVQYVYENYSSASNKRIYLITDGHEEDQSAKFSDLLNKYDTWRGDFDYLYYVDLRGEASDEYKPDHPGYLYGDGYPQFATMNPLSTTAFYTIGDSKNFELRFYVDNDSLFSELSFDIKIDSVKAIDDQVSVSVDITPSRGISKTSSNMTKIEEGKYKVVFSLDFIGTEHECDIFISMNGKTIENKHLEIIPNIICIEARNKKKILLQKPTILWQD